MTEMIDRTLNQLGRTVNDLASIVPMGRIGQAEEAELAAKFTPQVERHLSLAVASEVMRLYYEQGSELTVFTDSNTEDYVKVSSQFLLPQPPPRSSI